MAAVRRQCSNDAHTGGAWLSSARVVRCWVESRNERNPQPQLPPNRIAAQDVSHFPMSCAQWGSAVTATDKLEEGEDDVKSSCPGRPGPHTCYNGRDKRKFASPTAAEQIHKPGPSSDRGLQLARVK